MAQISNKYYILEKNRRILTFNNATTVSLPSCVAIV